MQVKEMYRLIAETGYLLVDPNGNTRGPVVDLAPGLTPDGWTEIPDPDFPTDEENPEEELPETE